MANRLVDIGYLGLDHRAKPIELLTSALIASSCEIIAPELQPALRTADNELAIYRFHRGSHALAVPRCRSGDSSQSGFGLERLWQSSEIALNGQFLPKEATARRLSPVQGSVLHPDSWGPSDASWCSSSHLLSSRSTENIPIDLFPASTFYHAI